MFNGQPPGEAKSSVCGRTWGPGAMAYRCSDWYLGVVHGSASFALNPTCVRCVRCVVWPPVR
jgi:hypothetical protein